MPYINLELDLLVCNVDVIIRPAEQLAAFETVCEQMLEDVQERLVYRTHIYIRAEILGYKPADGDLAYPAKLEMMEVSLATYCDIILVYSMYTH